MTADPHSDDREVQGLALENTGPAGKRLAAIHGRALKAGLRRTAKASRRGFR